jgi:hypothetical protein
VIEFEAGEELFAAGSGYEDQRKGFGQEVLSAALLSRSSYAGVFVRHEGDVRTVAFAHAKRVPGYWTRRV